MACSLADGLKDQRTITAGSGTGSTAKMGGCKLQSKVKNRGGWVAWSLGLWSCPWSWVLGPGSWVLGPACFLFSLLFFHPVEMEFWFWLEM